MIDRKWIGHVLPDSVLPVERTRLKFFAKAIGETNPIYFDEAAARDAGHPDIPAPPTFLFSAEMDSDTTVGWLKEAGIPIGKVLHGEQSFCYCRMVHAGDVVTVSSRLSDIYDKKNGALEFVVKESIATNQHGQRVAELRTVVVVRNQEGER